MKNRLFVTLLVAALLAVPALAQQTTSSDQTQPAATAAQPAQAAPQTATGATGKEPLTVQKEEGFWGKLNPFARKKYVQRQLQPQHQDDQGR
jgi:hypothetical protein